MGAFAYSSELRSKIKGGGNNAEGYLRQRHRVRKENKEIARFCRKDVMGQVSFSAFFLAFLCFSAFATAGSLTIDEQGRILVPEILALDDGQVIPDAVYDNYDSRSLGESIAARVERTKWPNREFRQWDPDVPDGPAVFKNSAKSSLQLYFPPDQIDEVQKSGFLNAFQVPSGEKVPGYLQERDLTEISLSGLRLQQVPSRSSLSAQTALRPKSLVFDAAVPENSEFTMTGAARFGKAVAVMHPDVSRRTTITGYDSMDLLKGPKHIGAIRSKTEVFTPFTPSLPLPEFQTEYFEGQVWGELDLRDVKELWLPHDGDPALVEKFKRPGLPLYEYGEEVRNGKYRRVRGRELSHGDLVTIKKMSESLRNARRAPPEVSSIRDSRSVRAAKQLTEQRPISEILSNLIDPERAAAVDLYANVGDKAAIDLFLERYRAEPYALLDRMESSSYRMSPRLLGDLKIRNFIEETLKVAVQDPASSARVISMAATRYGMNSHVSPSLQDWVVSRISAGDESSYRLPGWLRLKATPSLEAAIEKLWKKPGVRPFDWLFAVPEGFRSPKILTNIIEIINQDPENYSRRGLKVLAQADLTAPGARAKLAAFARQAPNFVLSAQVAKLLEAPHFPAGCAESYSRISATRRN